MKDRGSGKDLDVVRIYYLVGIKVRDKWGIGREVGKEVGELVWRFFLELEWKFLGLVCGW